MMCKAVKKTFIIWKEKSYCCFATDFINKNLQGLKKFIQVVYIYIYIFLIVKLLYFYTYKHLFFMYIFENFNAGLSGGLCQDI